MAPFGCSARTAAAACLLGSLSTVAFAQAPISKDKASVIELPAMKVAAPKLEDSGPTLSSSGASDYGITASDITNLPAGEGTTITGALQQMPGVAIDQNQQIHIRNTEGPQFQYQINGILVPLDINTNPPFISMINPMFVKQMHLLVGVVPSRYSYATGGIVNITTKDGCEQQGGSAALLVGVVGQRQTLEPRTQYGGCRGNFSYYLSALYNQGNTAFSPATSSPDPIHNETHQGQGFGFFSYDIDSTSRLSLILSAAASRNQLPNVPNLTPQFTLAGVSNYPSSAINSYLNFRDGLAVLAFNAAPTPDLSYQLAYAVHSITQNFKPDNAGELIYQGVASTAKHQDADNTLEGDLTYTTGSHTLSSGFYLGVYHVSASDSSLVFPADAEGNQISDTPIQRTSNAYATNVLSGVYLNDLWYIDRKWSANVGVRFDALTGFTKHHQIDPTVNFTYRATRRTALHGGFARYMQVPSWQGISPDAQAAFAGTTAASPPGIASPLTEDDYVWDVGVIHHPTPRITLSQDNYYEITRHYLDTGQFGVVPIFAPFNYDHGYIWGSEFAAKYRGDDLSAYANLTVGKAMEKGVATGQFNFDPAELSYINQHYIVLDHQPLIGVSAGAAYHFDPYTVSLDMIYSSGLRAGFADLEKLPTVVQVNASIQRAFQIPGIGRVTDRITVLNLFDRVNLIRPSEGIGIFEPAYGPRISLLNTITVPF